MKRGAGLFVWVGLLVFPAISSAQVAQPLLDLRVPFAPETIVINATPSLYYELQITNLRDDTIRLTRLEISDSSKHLSIAAFDRHDLLLRIAVTGGTTKTNADVPPHRAQVIYIEAALPVQKPTTRLTHQITYRLVGESDKNEFTFSGTAVAVTGNTKLMLGPPLQGGPWAAVYDPSWERGHRRVIYNVDQRDRIPGRFAIDFIKLDQQGHYAASEDNIVKNWLGYASPVLAVADGRVAGVRDDFSESPTLAGHKQYPADSATGNYISLDIGNGRFVFYEHLQPGSIKVKVGQQIKKGEVIAALGFTGQTTGPHLHLHVADFNSPLSAEGVAFGFDHFTLLGAYSNFADFGKAPWKPVRVAGKLAVTDERPAPKTVIIF